MSKITNGRLDR